MSEFVMTLTGASLLQFLEEECGLSPATAREFIVTRAGGFEPSSVYGVGYARPVGEEDWCYQPGLRIWRIRSPAKEDG